MKKKRPVKFPLSLLIPLIFATGFFSGGVSQQHLPLGTQTHTVSESAVQVCFTPSMRCLPLIETAINQAQKTIQMQCYSFTSAPIADALLRAHQRGVKVEIIADRSQKTAPYSKIKMLHEVGIPVFIDSAPGIAHNKIIICDESKVISGSYNFSHSAESRNTENVVIISNACIAQQYLQNWQNHKALATPLRSTTHIN